MASKCVNEFNVGDGIVVYGWKGTVTEVEHITRYDIDHKTGEKTNPKPCTYVTVAFDEPAQVGYQYHNASFGGLDNVVAYGYFKR